MTKVEGPSSQPYEAILGLTGGTDGAIPLADGQSAKIRIFDASNIDREVFVGLPDDFALVGIGGDTYAIDKEGLVEFHASGESPVVELSPVQDGGRTEADLAWTRRQRAVELHRFIVTRMEGE